jgi:hypothetical protein
VWPHLDASEGRSKLTREGRDGAGEATEGGLGSLRPESTLATTRFPPPVVLALHDRVESGIEEGVVEGLGYFDDETCRLEPIANPLRPESVTHVSGIIRHPSNWNGPKFGGVPTGGMALGWRVSALETFVDGDIAA